jgi:hypothetical protein
MLTFNRLYINHISSYMSSLNNVYYVNMAVVLLGGIYGTLDPHGISWPDLTEESMAIYGYLLINGISSFLV